MTATNLIDSSVWIAYFQGDPASKPFVDGNRRVATSVLSLFEVSKRLRKWKYASVKIAAALSFMRQRGLMVDVDGKIAEQAAVYAESLSIADALLYASAQLNGFAFVTKDNDFRNLPGVKIVR